MSEFKVLSVKQESACSPHFQKQQQLPSAVGLTLFACLLKAVAKKCSSFTSIKNKSDGKTFLKRKLFEEICSIYLKN